MIQAYFPPTDAFYGNQWFSEERSGNGKANKYFDSTSQTPADNDTMSSETPSKEWFEKELSALDNKIKIQEANNKVLEANNNAKLEKLIGESNVKFEKLIGEMNTKFSKIEENIAKSESTHTKWMLATGLALFGTILTTSTFLYTNIKSYIPSAIHEEVKGDLANINNRFSIIDKRNDDFNQKITVIDQKLVTLDKNIANVDNQLSDHDKKLDSISEGIARLAKKQ